MRIAGIRADGGHEEQQLSIVEVGRAGGARWRGFGEDRVCESSQDARFVRE